MISDNPHLPSDVPPGPLIGMVHLAPLPGSPASGRSLRAVCDAAVADAMTLIQAGFDALMVENFGDAPFRATRVDPHTVSAMTVAARRLRELTEKAIGVNVLRNDPCAALAVAVVAGLQFIRVNVHCGVYATDQGIIEGRADETLRYRARLWSEMATAKPRAAMIFADVHVKHARSLRDEPIADAAREIAYRGRADALIVSGAATGAPTNMSDLLAVKSAVPDRPLYVGSGASLDNARDLLTIADGLIVGTAIKTDGVTTAPVDAKRAAALVNALR